jgi:hypothetical protein
LCIFWRWWFRMYFGSYQLCFLFHFLSEKREEFTWRQVLMSSWFKSPSHLERSGSVLFSWLHKVARPISLTRAYSCWRGRYLSMDGISIFGTTVLLD